MRVGVLGVGPVGEHIVRVLRERKFPVDGDVTVMATREREEIIDGNAVSVQKVSEALFRRLDLQRRSIRRRDAPTPVIPAFPPRTESV